MKKVKKVFVIVALLFTSVLSFWRPLKTVNATGDSQGETWIINENPSFSCYFDVNFTSNNTEYVRFDLIFYDDSYEEYLELSYYETDPYKKTAVYIHDYLNSSNTGWLDEAYRTITFDTAPTGDLLTWLESNAVKVVEEIPVESIEIGIDGGKLFVGGTYQIVPIVLPENATAEVTYYSNNEAVATVSDSGLVTAVDVGTATITASAGDKSDTIIIKVVQNTYLGGYNDGYDEGYAIGMADAIDMIFENGIEDFTNGSYKQVNSYDYLAGYQYGDYYQGMTDVFWKGLPTDHPLHGQYALSWWYNHNVYYEGEYYDNPYFYEIITSTDEYHNAYSQGKADAMAENPEVVGFFGTLFSSIGSFLSIEILPNITLGIVLAVPLIFGIISFLIGKGK